VEVTPKAMILINGADVTGHTETVQFVDKEDNRADEVTITLDRNFARPSYKDVVLLYLGYKESGLYFCGKFFVQTSDRTDRFLRVKATSADLAGSIKERRTQSYEKISLCDIVGMIAGRNGLAAKFNGFFRKQRTRCHHRGFKVHPFGLVQNCCGIRIKSGQIDEIGFKAFDFGQDSCETLFAGDKRFLGQHFGAQLLSFDNEVLIGIHPPVVIDVDGGEPFFTQVAYCPTGIKRPFNPLSRHDAEHVFAFGGEIHV